MGGLLQALAGGVSAGAKAFSAGTMEKMKNDALTVREQNLLRQKDKYAQAAEKRTSGYRMAEIKEGASIKAKASQADFERGVTQRGIETKEEREHQGILFDQKRQIRKDDLAAELKLRLETTKATVTEQNKAAGTFEKQWKYTAEILGEEKATELMERFVLAVDSPAKQAKAMAEGKKALAFVKTGGMRDLTAPEEVEIDAQMIKYKNMFTFGKKKVAPGAGGKKTGELARLKALAAANKASGKGKKKPAGLRPESQVKLIKDIANKYTIKTPGIKKAIESNLEYWRNIWSADKTKFSGLTDEEKELLRSDD